MLGKYARSITVWIFAIVLIAPINLPAQEQGGESAAGQQQDQTFTAPEEFAETVDQATLVLRDSMEKGPQGISPELLDKAQGIVIIPNLVKAGFIAAGRHGTGVLLTHEGNQWSPPVFVSATGASIGAQVGITSTDLVMVFVEQQPIEEMLGGDLTLGVDAAVALGPLGAEGKTSFDEAEVYAYKRSEGVFAGVSVTGGGLTVNEEMTMAFYNIAEPEEVMAYYPDITIASILNLQDEKEVDQVPQVARQLQQVLKRHAAVGKAQSEPSR